MYFTIAILVFLYLIYEKYSETKQIKSVSNMNWLTFEQIQELVKEIKK